MNEIINKLYSKTKENALKDILEIYKKKWYCVVNYLYFANLIINGLLWKKNKNNDFRESLINWDFLLPDWIALKMYSKKHYNKDFYNLNWTDFCDFLLKNFKNKEINLILYWTKKEVIKKTVENIKTKYNLDTYYFQDGYSEFDFEKIKDLPKNKINIFMIWLWTPKQEVWINQNLNNIKNLNLITFSQWWTFDFLAWVEKRAPKIFIKLKLEWLWRFITNPKKNFKKVLYSFYLFYFLYRK